MAPIAFLTACSVPEAERGGVQVCETQDCSAEVENARRATEVPGVLVGMTRNEVVGVLGANFESFSGEGRPPVVDSFPYFESGQQKYIYVSYQSGFVRYAEIGFDGPFRVK